MLSGGDIAGIVIGVVVFWAAVITLCAWGCHCCCFYRAPPAANNTFIMTPTGAAQQAPPAYPPMVTVV